MVSLGARGVYCLVSQYGTVRELDSWRGGKTYMLTQGWIMNDAASHSHGIAEGTGLVNRNEEATCQG
jgi:hypothetical protein